jgi:hypothetical protein
MDASGSMGKQDVLCRAKKLLAGPGLLAGVGVEWLRMGRAYVGGRGFEMRTAAGF